MMTDLCIPLTMKVMGLGLPLSEAGRIAALTIIWVLLLCAMMGYTIRLPGVPEPDEPSGSAILRSRSAGHVILCGILPAIPGTAPGLPRSLLQPQ
ncbi:MAG: hypothetical protein PHT99_04165 [Methanoregula sp.]|nr:hypothetical protein [Methanoregula sp.]